MKLTAEAVMYQELVRAFALRMKARDIFGRDSDEYRKADRTVEEINAALIACQCQRAEAERMMAA